MKDKKIFSYLTIALGLWQLAAPLTFSPLFCKGCLPQTLSDIFTGFLFISLGMLSSFPNSRTWLGWLVGLGGLWLECAPLIFWAFSPLTYLNDTLVGAIAIVFCFQLTQGNTNEALMECPRGWSYNPSSWKHRLPTVGLAMLCWFFARYMAAYQLGYITHIWDPFFQEGTLRVITSDISKSFPVSDAGLGAFFYTIEALLGWQGGSGRYATMPWLVFSFAFLVLPVGIVSIVLIILQPIVVGAWCTWCLATAFCMLLMIVFTSGELVAAIQFVKQASQRGESFWRIFWKGGREIGESKRKAKNLFVKKKGWGIAVHWNLVISAVAGLLLLFLPTLFQFQGRLATSDYIEGLLVFVIAVISTAEVFRTLRFSLLALGAWLLIAPWWMASSGALSIGCHLLVGIVLILLPFVRNRITQRYGEWEGWMV